MSRSYHFSQLTVVDPASTFHGQEVSLQIEKGQITSIGPVGALTPQDHMEVISPPAGMRVSPGWVDSRAHLNDPGHEYKETLEEFSEAAWRGGFTHVLAYLDIEPIAEKAQVLRGLAQAIEGQPISIHLTGKITEGGAGKELAEMYDLQLAGARAFTDGLHRPKNHGILLRSLQYARAFGGLLVLPLLDEQLVPDGQMNEGLNSVRLGMKGIPELAESLTAASDIELLRYEPGKVLFQPISSPRALALLHAFRNEDDSSQVYTGVSLAHLIHDDGELDSFDSNLKLTPPLRSRAQVSLLHKALQSGEIDLIHSGHQAQGIEEKQVEFALAEPGMLGLQTFYPLCQQYLLASELIDEGKLVQLISLRPRTILGLPSASIMEGEEADLTFFHPNQTWSLQTQTIPSRAKNSPYIGLELVGRVFGVYTKGKLQVNGIWD